MLKYRNAVPVAAHRGNARYCPENTLASFRSALALKPDMLETDLHMTRDGQLVLMHDHLVDRTTDGTGLVREKTLREIRALDAGAWKGEAFKGERVPTFEEFLALTAGEKDLLFNIELKDYPADSGEFAFASARRVQVPYSRPMLKLVVAVSTVIGLVSGTTVPSAFVPQALTV